MKNKQVCVATTLVLVCLIQSAYACKLPIVFNTNKMRLLSDITYFGDTTNIDHALARRGLSLSCDDGDAIKVNEGSTVHFFKTGNIAKFTTGNTFILAPNNLSNFSVSVPRNSFIELTDNQTVKSISKISPSNIRINNASFTASGFLTFYSDGGIKKTRTLDEIKFKWFGMPYSYAPDETIRISQYGYILPHNFDDIEGAWLSEDNNLTISIVVSEFGLLHILYQDGDARLIDTRLTTDNVIRTISAGFHPNNTNTTIVPFYGVYEDTAYPDNSEPTTETIHVEIPIKLARIAGKLRLVTGDSRELFFTKADGTEQLIVLLKNVFFTVVALLLFTSCFLIGAICFLAGCYKFATAKRDKRYKKSTRFKEKGAGAQIVALMIVIPVALFFVHYYSLHFLGIGSIFHFFNYWMLVL